MTIIIPNTFSNWHTSILQYLSDENLCYKHFIRYYGPCLILLVLLDCFFHIFWLLGISLLGLLLVLLLWYLERKKLNRKMALPFFFVVNLVMMVHDILYGCHTGFFTFFLPLFSLSVNPFAIKPIWGFIFIWSVLILWALAILANPALTFPQLSFFVIVQYTCQMACIILIYFFLAHLFDRVFIKNLEKHKLLLNNDIRLLMLVDKEQRVAMFNNGFYAYYQENYQKELKAGRYLWDFVSPVNENILRVGFDKAFGGEVYNTDVKIAVNGEPKWVNLSFIPIADTWENVRYVSFSVSDISERKEKEDQLKDIILLQAKVTSELENFMYRSSHDIKGPISSTLGLISLYKITSSSEEKSTYVNMIEKSILKLNRIHQTITDYARTKSKAYSNESIDFLTVIQQAVKKFRYLKLKIDAQIRIEAEQKQEFYGNKEQIIVILEQLLSNAIMYYSPERIPQININAQIHAENAILTVKDNGIGIPENIKEHVFEMFFRGSVRSEGAGLGLYIVSEIVNSMQGTINFETKEGVGSTFEVMIPMKAPINR